MGCVEVRQVRMQYNSSVGQMLSLSGTLILVCDAEAPVDHRDELIWHVRYLAFPTMNTAVGIVSPPHVSYVIRTYSTHHYVSSTHSSTEKMAHIIG